MKKKVYQFLYGVLFSKSDAQKIANTEPKDAKKFLEDFHPAHLETLLKKINNKEKKEFVEGFVNRREIAEAMLNYLDSPEQLKSLVGEKPNEASVDWFQHFLLGLPLNEKRYFSEWTKYVEITKKVDFLFASEDEVWDMIAVAKELEKK